MGKGKGKSKSDICLRCGKCCILKYDKGDFAVVSQEYCPLFSMENGLGKCAVYGENVGKMVTRQHKCITAEMSAAARLLPNSCPYAKKIPGYATRVINFPGEVV
jgi:uncharacterized cysteine cluster protein YcgN (CxxCxxCC family)